METTRELSVRETASLLRYLAVCEVAAFSLHGDWLRLTEPDEPARIWFARNGLATDWLDRVVAARMAKAIARQVVARYSIAAGFYRHIAILHRLVDDELCGPHGGLRVARLLERSRRAVSSGRLIEEGLYTAMGLPLTDAVAV